MIRHSPTCPALPGLDPRRPHIAGPGSIGDSHLPCPSTTSLRTFHPAPLIPGLDRAGTGRARRNLGRDGGTPRSLRRGILLGARVKPGHEAAGELRKRRRGTVFPSHLCLRAAPCPDEGPASPRAGFAGTTGPGPALPQSWFATAPFALPVDRLPPLTPPNTPHPRGLTRGPRRASAAESRRPSRCGAGCLVGAGVRPRH